MPTVKKPRKRKRRRHYIVGIYVSIKSGASYKHRSGWERSYMIHLDANVDVISWSYESFFIKYVSNLSTGRQRSYYPDFRVEYADGHVEIVEIKPSKRLNQLTVKKKLDAARVWCSANGAILRVITEHDLVGLGLL